jgi:branched-chain amino acid transport system ATP-binding protein
MNPAQVVKQGIIQVMEGRRLFEHLTVDDDLLTGAYTRGRETREVRQDLERVFEYFPRLRERRSAKTGYISGGEKQMVAIGRAFMARPKLMLLDEPSMGLAPLLVREIFDIVVRLNKAEGVAILLAEQNASMALEFATYGYVMENGRVVLDGDAQTLKDNEDIREFYLGLTEIGKKSYRDVKHYRRRKRWLA